MISYLILSGFILLIDSQSGKSQYASDLKIETILKTDTTSIGQKINYPVTQLGEITMLKITIPPGKTTGWHEHDFPVFAYVIKGTLTVEMKDRPTLQFTENSSFAEVIQTVHRGINNGPGELVLLAVYLGEKGKALSVKH
jgi:quercetin dioxygenase-like cupin family protein